jgi:crotonobetainyl-CoA:carnitine CoA-transferase CaiB-like acyl-CoA transferase
MDTGPLKGLRILDFTRVLAGPFATRILADFGADVIKVQSRKTAKGTELNTGAFFSIWNRNKRSITLDMGHPEARELALRLVAISDVVIENFTPRVMSNWTMTYEDLKGVKPDLIMVSISAAGQTGPWRDFVAFGPTAQALGGLTYLTSYDEDAPIGAGYAYVDPMAGLFGAVAVLAALEYRDRTGRGQFIDLSTYEVAAALIGPALMEAATQNTRILPLANRSYSGTAAPHGCFKCKGKDRWCVIAVYDDAEWQALCDVLGDSNWISDKRFATLSRRKKHARELDELIQQKTSQRSAQALVTLLQEAGVPAAAVQDAEDLANDPHLLARGFFVHLPHPTLGNTVSDGSPIKFRKEIGQNWKCAPTLGEDNRFVFMDLLGLTEAQFLSYIDRKIIA